MAAFGSSDFAAFEASSSAASLTYMHTFICRHVGQYAWVQGLQKGMQKMETLLGRVWRHCLEEYGHIAGPHHAIRFIVSEALKSTAAMHLAAPF